MTIADVDLASSEFWLEDDDVHFASRHPEIYSSYPNIGISDIPAEVAEFFGSMIAAHPDGHAELVSELAGPLPHQIICDMMGIPEEDHQRVFHWTNVILGAGDPDVAAATAEFAKASMDFGAYSMDLAEQRRRAPGRSDHPPAPGPAGREHLASHVQSQIGACRGSVTIVGSPSLPSCGDAVRLAEVSRWVSASDCSLARWPGPAQPL